MDKRPERRNRRPVKKRDLSGLRQTLHRVWLAVSTVLKIVLGALLTVLLIGIVCGFVFAGALGDYLQKDILPMADLDMSSYDQKDNSVLYYVDADGKIQVYQQVFASTSSKWAVYDDIPKDLINAAIAIEDHRFNEHQGVDWITTVKACARMFFGDDSVGGSSITQQTIKNILLSSDDSADDVTVQRKVLEIFRAIQLEKNYTKEDIMETYLNVIYMGQGCRGVRSAAAAYFGKELELLTTAECASLISITNNPSLFDPYGDTFDYKPAGEKEARPMSGKERNRSRQLLVLGAMKEYGMITDEQYDEAVAQELVFKTGISSSDRLAVCPNPDCGYKNIISTFTLDNRKYYCPKCGTYTESNVNQSQNTYSWFTDTVLEDVAEQLALQSGVVWNSSTKEIYMQKIRNGGYHVYTTLDLNVQKQLDRIYTNLDEIPKARSGQQLQSAMVIIDNRSGDIVAMSGGVGEKTGFDDWNRATDAELQSGSSIKPLSIYAPGFELGAITPASVIRDLPLTYNNGPYPLNDDRVYRFSRTVFSGVVSSVNAIAANTLMQIGTKYSYEFAKYKFGISSLIEEYVDSTGYVHSDIGVGPLAMGAQTWGVKVRDMAGAFATFADNGVYRKPRTFTKVYDSAGNIVLDNEQETKQILSEKTVTYMNYCLTNATQSGTGYNADMHSTIGMTTAGKTGTTGDSKDRWYCGFTGYYTAAVWCGFDTPEVIYGISGNPAAILFRKVLEPLHMGKQDVPLYDKEKLQTVSVCLDSGKIATSACSADMRGIDRVASAGIYPEDISSEVCDKHVWVDYCVTGGGVANEYCKSCGAQVEKRSFVKMTSAEMDSIARAASCGLTGGYMNDSNIYLINEDGSDAAFHGFSGNVNSGITAPYKVCTVHDSASATAETETEE